MNADGSQTMDNPGGGISQSWTSYSSQDHATWDILFARQIRILKNRADLSFFRGIHQLSMDQPGIPNLEYLSDRLEKLTGWRIVCVPGLIEDAEFFEHLANRRFVASRFIRSPDQIDYLEAPDIFHDVFGHVPMLSDPVFADYLQAYGLGGLKANDHGALERLARLYWYTVEFGLVETSDGLRIYGAGIVSSYAESIYCLSDSSPLRLPFDLQRVMQTRYEIDRLQRTYFIIPSFQHLLDQTLKTDFLPLYADLRAFPDIPSGYSIAGEVSIDCRD